MSVITLRGRRLSVGDIIEISTGARAEITHDLGRCKLGRQYGIKFL